VELRINFVYTRATSDQTLIDVEIDLAAPLGSELFANAAAGRISPVFAAAQQGRGILVHKALLTHDVTRSSQLQFNRVRLGVQAAVRGSDTLRRGPAVPRRWTSAGLHN
jgi:hypothetical protein